MSASVLWLRAVELVAADDDDLIAVRAIRWLRTDWLWPPLVRAVVDGIVVPLIWLAVGMYAAAVTVAVVANIVDSIWDFVATNCNSVLLVSVDEKIMWVFVLVHIRPGKLMHLSASWRFLELNFDLTLYFKIIGKLIILHTYKNKESKSTENCVQPHEAAWISA